MQGYQKKLLIVLAIVALFAAVRFLGLGEDLTFEQLQNNKVKLQQIVSDNYSAAIGSYILIYITATGLSIPGATILTLAGGFLFGAVLAAIYVNIGATLGAALVFLFARYLVGNWFQEKYEDKLNKFNQELAVNGYSYMLTLRLIPVFPFFLINILAGLTQLPLKTFIWTTAVGIFPGSLVYTFAGSQLSNIQSPKDIFSAKVLAAFLLLGLLAMFPALLNYLKRLRQRNVLSDS